MKTCDSCQYWRQKTDEYGICDNPQNLTSASSPEIIQRLAPCIDRRDAEAISDSIRYHKKFGCIHYKKLMHGNANSQRKISA